MTKGTYRLTCNGVDCDKEGEAIPIVAKKRLLGDHGPLIHGIIPVKLRVIGWYNYDISTFCSLRCYVEALDLEHYRHYDQCGDCNYDKDCFICSVDDGTQRFLHQCNCSEGLGVTYCRDGWGYYRKKLIDRLRRKLESREQKKRDSLIAAEARF